MIDRNHPAVEAALDAEDRTDGPMCRDTAHYMLECALPPLTATTEENLARLCHTPAGRALMRAGWVAAWQTISNDPDRIYDEPDDAFNAQFDALEGETP